MAREQTTDFIDSIVPPCADFKSTLQLIYGDYPFEAEFQEDAMLGLTRETLEHFGYEEGVLPFMVSIEQIDEYIQHPDRLKDHIIYGHLDAVAKEVVRILRQDNRINN